jgi:hypothetical protein
VNGGFPVEPGVWLLSTSERIDRSSLPAQANRVGFDEYHVNDRLAYPDFIRSLAPKEFSASGPVEIRACVANTVLPDEVKLWVRPAGARAFGPAISMHRARGNDYVAVVPSDRVPPGRYDYAVSARTGSRVTTFPGGVPQQPGDWPFQTDSLWSFRVTPPGLPMRLLDPKEDYAQLSFVRPREQYRSPFFQIVPGEYADEAALRLTLPDLGKDSPERYAAALFIGDAISARRADLNAAKSLDIKLIVVGGARKTIDMTLIERDGTAWTTPVVARSAWSTVAIDLDQLHLSRSILIPSPFPGLWNYWRDSAVRRGQQGDHVQLENVERLQLTVHANTGDTAGDDGEGAAIESIRVTFAGGQ